jgi:hypothetical protein
MKEISEEEIRDIVKDEMEESRISFITKFLIVSVVFSLLVAIPALASVNIRDTGNLVLHDGTNLDMSNNRIMNLDDPVSSQDAVTMNWINNRNYATENYVDTSSVEMNPNVIKYTDDVPNDPGDQTFAVLSGISNFDPGKDILLEFKSDEYTGMCSYGTTLEILYNDGSSVSTDARDSSTFIDLNSDAPIEEVRLKAYNSCGGPRPLTWTFGYIKTS